MAYRLVIDNANETYVVDAAKSSSASSTTGARLFGPEEGPFRINVQSGAQIERYETQLRIRVTAATTAALVTAVLEVLAVLQTIRGRTIEIRYDATNVLFQLPLAAWTTFSADYDVRYLEGGVEIDVTFSAEKPAGGDDDGAPTGALGRLDWQYVRVATGLALVEGEVTFKDRASAFTWLNDLRSGSNLPSWMPASFRVLEENIGYPSLPSSPQGDYEVPCKVLMKQLPAFAANDSTFDNFRAVEYQVQISNRASIDRTRAPKMVNRNVLITGTLVLKTDRNTSIDASDPAGTATADIYAAVDAAVDAIHNDADTRTGETSIEKSRDYTFNDNGEIAFTLAATSVEGTVLSWQESIELILEPQADIIRDYKGKARVYPRAGGARAVLSHHLTAESHKRLTYRAPLVSNPEDWLFTGGRVPRVKYESNQDEFDRGLGTYTMRGSTSWEYLSDETPIEEPAMGGEYDIEDVVGRVT